MDLLGSVLALQAVFTVAAGVVVIVDPLSILDRPGARFMAGSLVLVSLAGALLGALRARRGLREERARAQAAARLMDTVMTTSREWLWALDERGNFTFSSPASTGLLGYHPAELAG